MKKYCSCGHPTEYSIVPPTKCEKCSASFAAVAAPPQRSIHVSTHIHDNGQPARSASPTNDDADLEDSDFDSFMQGEPEPISQQEIDRIFLAGASRGVNLRDLIEKEGKNKDSKAPTPKRKTSRARKRK